MIVVNLFYCSSIFTNMQIVLELSKVFLASGNQLFLLVNESWIFSRKYKNINLLYDYNVAVQSWFLCKTYKTILFSFLLFTFKNIMTMIMRIRKIKDSSDLKYVKYKVWYQLIYMEIKEKHYQFVCQQTTDISACLTFTFTFPLWIYRSDQMTQVQN